MLPHRPAKKPRGENGAEALPIFPRPPSVDGVVWPDGRRNRHENQPHGPCRRGEAEPPRVGYGDGAPRGNDKATAFAAMLVRVTMSAQRTGDKEAAAVALTTTPKRRMALPHADESNDDAHQGARRRPPHATKVARRTGVDEAAFALTMMMPRMMTMPPVTRTPTTAPMTMPMTTPRGAQSRGRPGRLTTTAQGVYARRPPPTAAMTRP